MVSRATAPEPPFGGFTTPRKPAAVAQIIFLD